MKNILEPLAILDRSRFTQFGVKDKIEAIEIYNGRSVKIIKENKEEFQVPKYLMNLPNFTNLEKTNSLLQNCWIQVTQLDNDDYALEINVKAVGGGKDSDDNEEMLCFCGASDASGVDKNDKESSNYRLYEFFKEKGVSVNYVGKSSQNSFYSKNIGKTPLIIAVLNNSPYLVKWLVENGADKNFKYQGKTAYVWASEKGYNSCKKFIYN